jgi:hypothetical protein
MNNSINHKFHHISRAEYQELLAVSRGDAVADYIIDNVSILDLINGGEISGPIVIKGRYIADGTPVFGLTGWAGTFAALDIAAIGCICLMAIVAVMEERKIRREKKIQQLTVA